MAMNYWDLLYKCPVCGAMLDKSDRYFAYVDYYDDNHKHMSNMAGTQVPLCGHCACKIESSILSIHLDQHSNLVITEKGVTRILTSPAPFMAKVKCMGCGNPPEVLDEYIFKALYEPENYSSPFEAVVRGDNTYSRFTGLFCCIECYKQRDSDLEPPEE